MGLSSKQVSGDIHYWPPQVYLEIPKPERQEEKQNAKLLKCPRCDSTNTKFCYYNNYNRSQPRHFCRACRRHWTEGGTLRNVPIGGCRKNKRRKITPTSTSSAGAGAGAGNHPASSIATAPGFGDIEGAIFPEILRQVLLHPLPPPQLESPNVDATDGLFGASLQYTSQTFLEDFGAGSSGFVWSGGSIPFTTEASSCSSTSPYTCRGQDIVGGCEDGLLGMMDASTASAWVNEEPVLPASYWDFWDGAVDVTEAYVGQPVIPQ